MFKNSLESYYTTQIKLFFQNLKIKSLMMENSVEKLKIYPTIKNSTF